MLNLASISGNTGVDGLWVFQVRSTHIFTFQADSVNFNALTDAQQSAISAGADIYDGLGGSDTVTLPNESSRIALHEHAPMLLVRQEVEPSGEATMRLLSRANRRQFLSYVAAASAILASAHPANARSSAATSAAVGRLGFRLQPAIQQHHYRHGHGDYGSNFQHK
jgi:hypothetical protein